MAAKTMAKLGTCSVCGKKKVPCMAQRDIEKGIVKYCRRCYAEVGKGVKVKSASTNIPIQMNVAPVRPEPSAIASVRIPVAIDPALVDPINRHLRRRFGSKLIDLIEETILGFIEDPEAPALLRSADPRFLLAHQVGRPEGG